MEMFKKLPEDILNLVLEYQGFHKERNGKFIGQIKQNDSRRKILLKIPKICKVNGFSNEVEFIKMFDERFYKFIIKMVLLDEKIIWKLSVAKMHQIVKGRFIWFNCMDKYQEYVLL